MITEDSGCGTCGGTVAPDGHCWDCGAAQPAYRAHLEVAAANGAAGVSDRGRRREVNADAMVLVAVGAWTVGVVCDGVSMAPRAERAAVVAAEVGAAAIAAGLRAGALPETVLADAAVRAGRAVTALAAGAAGTEAAAPAGVGGAPACTFAAGVAGPEGVWSCWVGDSRAYWLPDEGPGMALTADDTGELEALTAWLGADAGDPVPGVRSYRPAVPGRLLLCTDGLWRHLPGPAALRAVLPGLVPRDLLPDARTLVDHALAAGGEDNITAVLVPVPACVRPAAPA
ncbi:PP2C family protein-serine/threonine phosphatase [Kitasatospora cinereorecta]|uniref:PP2C family protein-serine/threonine phosphatase n=1 Tax=Kitasatospora cinereorecta TaxID=285560 RepID=A0ABW0VHD8_9ACTN